MSSVVTENYFQSLLDEATRIDSPQAITRLQWGKRSILDPNFPMTVENLWLYLRDREVPLEDIANLQKLKPPKPPKAPKGISLNVFMDSVGKPVVLGLRDDELEASGIHLKAIAKAITTLPRISRSLYQTEVRKVSITRPRKTEDASWDPGGILRFSMKLDTAPDVGILRMRTVHEMGHALEEKLGLTVTPWNSVYGNPPFISDYARMNATEDFAETFRAWETERGLLRSTAPDKYEDMKGRVG